MASKACRYGEKCSKKNDAKHNAQHSHPTTPLEHSFKEKVSISKKTKAPTRKIEKIVPNTSALIELQPAPEGLHIPAKYKRKDPRVLVAIEKAETTETAGELRKIISSQLENLTKFEGQIKLHARFGKNVFYNVPAGALQHPSPANDVEKALSNRKLKSFFSMGVADETPLLDRLTYIKAKETFNIKLLINPRGRLEHVLLTVIVKDGGVRFARALTDEKKHITDQLCLNENVDIRLSLESNTCLTGDALLDTVRGFASQLGVKAVDGENTLLLPVVPNIRVDRIQHKKRRSYIFQEAYQINIVNVSLYQCEKRILDPDYVPPKVYEFVVTPTEVEVANSKWQQLFKSNKPGHTKKPWTAKEIIDEFPPFIHAVQEVAAVLRNAGRM